MNDFLPTAEKPWQVSGVRGRIISGKREHIYHGIGPDGCELAAVWFDTRTGGGLKDAHFIVRACNSHAGLLAQLKYAVKLLEALPGFRGSAQVDAMNTAIAKAEGTS